MDVTPTDLAKAFKNVIAMYHDDNVIKQYPGEIVRDNHTIEEKINLIRERFAQNPKEDIHFSQLLSGKQRKAEVVVTFQALLLTMIDRKRYKGILEAVFFAAGEPVTLEELSVATELDDAILTIIIKEMQEAYLSEDRGLRLMGLNDAWQLSTKPEYFHMVQGVLKRQQVTGLSRAALETLAIVAYRQPLTRVDIEGIRGVSSSSSMAIVAYRQPLTRVDIEGIRGVSSSSSIQRLLDRDLIEEAGRKDAPGRPFLYRTTVAFLRAMNLQSLEELPAFETFKEEKYDFTEDGLL